MMKKWLALLAWMTNIWHGFILIRLIMVGASGANCSGSASVRSATAPGPSCWMAIRKPFLSIRARAFRKQDALQVIMLVIPARVFVWKENNLMSFAYVANL